MSCPGRQGIVPRACAKCLRTRLCVSSESSGLNGKFINHMTLSQFIVKQQWNKCQIVLQHELLAHVNSGNRSLISWATAKKSAYLIHTRLIYTYCSALSTWQGLWLVAPANGVIALVLLIPNCTQNHAINYTDDPQKSHILAHNLLTVHIFKRRVRTIVT